MPMIDICEPFEDFEYNIVGNYRAYFVLLEPVCVLLLTLLSSILPKSGTRLYLQNLILLSIPLLPLRIIKTIYTLVSPYESSKSQLLCILLRIETIFQYTFNLGHCLTMNFYIIQVARFRKTSFDATELMRNIYISIDGFSLLFSTLFVNLFQYFNFFTYSFSIFYTISFLLMGYFSSATMIRCYCCCFSRRRIKLESFADDQNHFSYFWFPMVNFFAIMGHVYQSCAISSLFIPLFFPKFTADMQIGFRGVTSVLAARFLVSLIFATGPICLLPPLMLPIRTRIKRYRISSAAGSPEPIQAISGDVKL